MERDAHDILFHGLLQSPFSPRVHPCVRESRMPTGDSYVVLRVWVDCDTVSGLFFGMLTGLGGC